MERGNMLEPMARLAYEDMFGVEVVQIGFAELNSFAGISPDGLIGSSEALEIKMSFGTHTLNICLIRCQWLNTMFGNALCILLYLKIWKY